VLSGATIHLAGKCAPVHFGHRDPGGGGAKKPLRKFVDAPVEEYIKKEGLYL
jgi:hypothetical protein